MKYQRITDGGIDGGCEWRMNNGPKASRLRSHWPLWAALALFLLLLLVSLAGQISSGQLLLSEEPAYERLMVAKNLAAHFSWSINPGEFTSAFGTLLWPVLLAPIFFLLGASAVWPWLINAALSVLLIVLAYRVVREWIRPRRFRWYCLVC